MDIDIFLEDDHPHRDLQHLSPEYLRFALNRQTKELLKMAATPEFIQALADLVTAAKAVGAADPTAVTAAVTAAQADDLTAVHDAQNALTPPPAG